MQTLAVRCLAPLLLTGVVVALPQDGRSTDVQYWPSWRGPLGDGSAPSERPPTQWAEETEQGPAKNIAWKVAAPGHGSSSPIVWRDRIYLTTAIETDRSAESTALAPHDRRSLAPPTVVWEFVVVALNRTDGSLAWSTTVTETVPHEGGHATNSHASGSPVTDGERIYASFGSRGLYCLDLAGEVLWSKDFGLMRTRRQYGEASTPVLHDDRLILKWDHEGQSFLATFDKRTGDELWRQPRPEQSSWSTPIVVEVEGRSQIIVNATTASRGYDLESGEVVWSLSGMTENTIPMPIHFEGVVYLMSGYRGQMLQAVRLSGARGDLEGSRNVLWTHLRNTVRPLRWHLRRSLLLSQGQQRRPLLPGPEDRRGLLRGPASGWHQERLRVTGLRRRPHLHHVPRRSDHRDRRRTELRTAGGQPTRRRHRRLHGDRRRQDLPARAATCVLHRRAARSVGPPTGQLTPWVSLFRASRILPMHAPETAALVARATQGDHPAVEDLLIAHLPQLRAYVRLHSDNLVRDRESCSDLVQSVCREVLQDMRGFEFQGEAPFRKWLFQKALSKIVDRKRRWLTDKRDPAREATLDTTQVKGVYASFCTPSQVAIGNEAMERLERAFDELPGDYQQVITLHRLIGMSHAEIASEMDRGEGAVRALLNRALVRLGIVMTRR